MTKKEIIEYLTNVLEPSEESNAVIDSLNSMDDEYKSKYEEIVKLYRSRWGEPVKKEIVEEKIEDEEEKKEKVKTPDEIVKELTKDE